MWIVAPMGITVSRMSAGTPILSAARRFEGIREIPGDGVQ
jgi:hypothetical protein